MTAPSATTFDHVAAWNRAEAMFSPERYMGASTADLVHVERGTVPLLFSAPHAVAHVREGTLKPADLGTGGLAVALAQATGTYAIAQSGVASRDGNWYTDTTYKRYLDQVTEHTDAVIDLHGMKDDYNIDVCVGTGRHSMTSLDLLVLVLERLQAEGLRVSVNDPYDAHREGTVTTHCQLQGLQALQLELSNTTRLPGSSESEAFVRAMTAVTERL